MKSPDLTLRLYVFGVYAVLTYGNKCGQSEYRSAAGECCPMCNIDTQSPLHSICSIHPDEATVTIVCQNDRHISAISGEKRSVVLRDCIGDYSTTCKPCSKGTFMNDPNGLNECFSCKSCDTGLYVLQECSTISDTVCEVLDGYYCLQKSGRECSLASKHSECEPGQQVKTAGTKDSDTVCEQCPPGFYSPKGVNCTKWTDCLVNNEIEDQEGTSTTDVQCKPSRTRYVVLAVVLTLILTVIGLYLCHRQEIKSITQLRSPVEETGLEASICVPSSSNRVVKQETDSPT